MAFPRIVSVSVFTLLFLLTNQAFSKPSPTSCKTMTFSDKKSFDSCMELPTLNALLHYSYNPSTSTLTMAFTAPPPVPNGWVSWALNPKTTAMAGSQALIAFKPNTSGPISVNTYDIVSYGKIPKGPIAYNVTGLSAEESSGTITIFATWIVPNGETTVNQVWQVGPVKNGKPGKHEFEPENLESVMKLTLSDGPVGAPADSPAGAPAASSSANIESSSPAPAAQQGNGALKGVVSMVLVVGALIASLL